MHMRLGLWWSNPTLRAIGSLASIALLLYVTSSTAFAADPVVEPAKTKFLGDIPNAQEILASIKDNIPFFMKMVTAIAYVMGMYFIVTAVFKLKQYGEARTQMSQQHHLREPIMYFVAGTLLLYLPSAVQVGWNTFWQDISPFAHVEDKGGFAELYSSVFAAIKLFGTIAFVRGLVLLAKAGGGHGQPGAMAKGMTHIIGGLFCINIDQFVQLLLVTLGILSR